MSRGLAVERNNVAENTVDRYITLLVATLVASLVIGCGGGGDTIKIASLTEGRWGHSATLLDDGRVLVVGGKERPYGSLGSAEMFDPITGTWSPAENMLTPRGEGHTATLLNDGRVLVTGSENKSLAEVYDPSTGQWAPAGTMMNARRGASATLLDNGRVLVAGGEDSTVTGSKVLDSAEIYDPSTGEWTATGSMMQAHSGHSATLFDGKPFIVGEYLAEIFDPLTETWSNAGEPVRERALGSTATAMKNGEVLVTGGEWHFDASRINRAGVGSGASFGTGHGGPTARHQLTTMNPLSNSEMYNTITRQWTSVESMGEPRNNHSAILLDDGRVLVVGSSNLEAFDPDTGAWSSIGKLHQEHGESSTATLLKDGRILIVGGKSKTDESFRGLTSAEVYIPSAKQ